MALQVMVVGLGQFGRTLAKTLTQREVEVLAVDSDPERVDEAASYAAEAVCVDATDERALAQLSPQRRDVSVVAIGDSSREASIVCTALLRQMGCKRVVARSIDDIHGRILGMVGAHHVVSPEAEHGERFASLLMYKEMRSEMMLGPGVVIAEIEVPHTLVGKSLLDLRLRKRFSVSIVAVRRGSSGEVHLPEPEDVFHEGDIVVTVGSRKAVTAFLEKM